MRILNRKYFTMYLLLALVIQALIASTSIPSLVLCVGTDGHLQVELKSDHHPCPVDCASTEATEEPSAEPVHLHDNDCTDISLFVELVAAVPDESKSRPWLLWPQGASGVFDSVIANAENQSLSLLYENASRPQISLIKAAILRC